MISKYCCIIKINIGCLLKINKHLMYYFNISLPDTFHTRLDLLMSDMFLIIGNLYYLNFVPCSVLKIMQFSSLIPFLPVDV